MRSPCCTTTARSPGASAGQRNRQPAGPGSGDQGQERPYLARGKPARRPQLRNEDDHTIVSVYGAEYRGIVQYYLLAGNVARLYRLHWVMETSLLKTLADKHRSSVTKMARKHKAAIDTPRGPRKCVEARIEHNGRKPLVARLAVFRCGGRRTRSSPTASPSPASPPQGTGHPAPGGPVRDLRARGRGGRPPGPQTRRPRQAGTTAARVGGADGTPTAQDPRGLPVLP